MAPARSSISNQTKINPTQLQRWARTSSRRARPQTRELLELGEFVELTRCGSGSSSSRVDGGQHLKGRLKGGGCSTNTKRGQHGQQRQRQRQQRHLQREGEHEKERREAARATAGSKGEAAGGYPEGDS
jgi:hypothetical protein